MASKKENLIKKFFDNTSLCEIYSMGLEFSFISEEGQQCHPFVLCKDFLHDAVWAAINKTNVHIYGFGYSGLSNSKNPPIDLKKMRMAVRLKKSKGLEKMVKCSVKLINKLEEAMHFKPTKVHFGGKFKSTEDEVWVFVGDRRWMHAPPLISLYTILIRAGTSYAGENWETFLREGAFAGAAKSNDKRYCKSSEKAWKRITSNPVTKVFARTRASNYPKDVTTGSLHGSMGIVAFANGNVPAAVKSKWKLS